MRSVIILIAAFLFCHPGVCLSADFYVAQTQAGDHDGSSCSDAYAVTWLNSSGNWANPKELGKIGPNDTVHLCGTITTGIDISGSGSQGSSITILWETDAKLSQTGETPGALLSGNGNDYLVFDGGTNGTVECTANGTALAYHTIMSGFNLSSSHDIEIRNLTFKNIYVAAAPADETDGFASAPTAIYANGNDGNMTIHDNVFSNVCWAISLASASGASRLTIYNNTFSNYDHGVAFGGSASPGFDGVYIYNNTFGSTSNWDTTTNRWHHDGIHLYHGTTDIISTVRIYNNIFNGSWGNNNTSQIFLEGHQSSTVECNGHNEGGISDLWLYNNFLTHTNSKMNNASVNINGCNTLVMNNTVICDNNGSEVDVGMGFGGTSPLADGTKFINNIVSGCRYPIGGLVGEVVEGAYFDYNLYIAVGASPDMATWYPEVGGEGSYLDFSEWKTSSGGADVHSQMVATDNIGTDGLPLSGSSAIGSGISLSTYFTTDILGTTRGTTWDIGAYEYASSPDPPASPHKGRITAGAFSGSMY